MRDGGDWLEDEWRKRLEQIATNLATDGREHREIASLARQIQRDYHGRFLLELLQNCSDQARRGAVKGSSIHIVRLDDLLAVTNEGAPFDERGVRSVTELGLSTKKASSAIGNKGLGFKSVFEVCASPEICSAAEAGSFRSGGRRFRLSLDPFGDPRDAARLERFSAELLSLRADLVERIRSANKVTDPAAYLIEEARRAAPFRFPLALDADTLEDRLARLHLPERALQAQTIVMLPLSDAPKVQRVVTKGLDAMFTDGARRLLFLPAVEQIVVEDRTCRRAIKLVRVEENLRTVRRRGRVIEVGDRSILIEAPGQPVAEQRWVFAERTIGGVGTREPEQAAAQERLEIQAEVRKLEEQNWEEVDRARVSIAVRLPPDAAGCAPLDRDGGFFIGLPTQYRTRTPIDVDAPFYGNISRSNIDFGNEYNRLLLTEAWALLADFLDALREDPRIERRRLTALVVHGDGDEEFYAALKRSPDGLACGEVVLAADGRRFLRATDLVVPAPDALELFALLGEAVGSAERFGFELPDAKLLAGAREVLDALPGSSTADGAESRIYLERSRAGGSLLEEAARALRVTSGVSRFEEFLAHVLDAFHVDQLIDQKILPIGEAGLAAGYDRVFFRPVPRSKAGPTAGESEDLEPTDLPADVLAILPFIDESVVKVRTGERDHLTPLAQRLARDHGDGLVRRPRILEILGDAVVPKLEEISDRDDHTLAARLLDAALRWMQRNNIERVDGLRVPVVSSHGAWRWVSPGEAVFGSGWLDGPSEELLLRLYPSDEARRLVPWSELAPRLTGSDEEPDVAVWRARLAGLGVWSSPRVLTRTLADSPFRAASDATLRVVETPCPFPGCDDLWRRWIGSFQGMKVEYRRSQEYTFDRVHWIEHLEDPGRRSAVVESMLLRPAAYDKFLQSTLQRKDGKDAGPQPAFWSAMLATQPWPVIPTEHHERVEAAQAFQLTADQRLRPRYALLRHSRHGDARADRLLTAIGVVPLSDADGGRLIGALHELAAALPVGPDQESAARMLAEDLYDRLAKRCETDRPGDLTRLEKRPIPLLRGKALVSVVLLRNMPIHIVDDVVRQQLLPPDLLVVPLPGQAPRDALADRLRSALPELRVLFTSEVPIDSGFHARADAEPEGVFAAIRRRFPRQDLEIDLACILAYLGRTPLRPESQQFHKLWQRMCTIRVVPGRFAAAFPHASLLVEDNPPTLQVQSDLAAAQLVEAVWPCVGLIYRDLMALYARALEHDRVDRFFDERHVGSAERREIEESLGTFQANLLAAIKPLLLAIWRAQHPGGTMTEFADAYAALSAGRMSLDAALGRADVRDWLYQRRALATERIVTEGMASFAVEGPAIASAIADLGSDFVFRASVTAWEQQQRQLTARCKAFASWSGPPDVAVARRVIEALGAEKIRPELAAQPNVHAQITASLVDRALELAGSWVTADARGTFAAALQGRPPSGVSEEEIEEYATRDEVVRTMAARELLEGRLRVAALVVEQSGASWDASRFRTDPRVKMTAEGYLANRHGLLAALATAIERVDPALAGKLRDARGFDASVPDQEVARNLGLSSADAPPTRRPVPSVVVLGMTLPVEALNEDLSRGADGQVGRRLIDVARRERGGIDLAALRVPPPPTARVPVRAPHPPQTTRGSHAGARMVRDRVGLIGEIYAFELFQTLLPGFSQADWCSENRSEYGLIVPGHDDRGADFEYIDQTGGFAGKGPGVRCMIEVKSSAGDANGPFHLSINQWNVAQDCHRASDRAYIIVRIADVETTPRLAAILVDPVQMEHKQQLALSPHEMWVWVGRS